MSQTVSTWRRITSPSPGACVECAGRADWINTREGRAGEVRTWGPAFAPYCEAHAGARKVQDATERAEELEREREHENRARSPEVPAREPCRLVCAQCGGKRVQVLEWIDPHARTIEDDAEPHYDPDRSPAEWTWCLDCAEGGGEHTGLICENVPPGASLNDTLAVLRDLVTATEEERATRERHFTGPPCPKSWKRARDMVAVALEAARKAGGL